MKEAKQPTIETDDKLTEEEQLLQQFKQLGTPPRNPSTFLHVVLTIAVFNWLVPSSHENFLVMLFILLIIVGAYLLTIHECNKLNQRIDVMWQLLKKQR